MKSDIIQAQFADRIGGKEYGKSTAIYKFEKIKRAKRAAREAHPTTELLDFGVGEPDAMAFPSVVKTLADQAHLPENRGYADNGDAVLLQAAARFLDRECGVKLDPETQILHSIGSKAALSILPACFINPGDVALMTTPGYPVFGTHARYYGGEVYNLKLTEANQFLPDLESIPEEILRRAKTLVINYPNNPTGASATPEFFADVVAFAKKHDIIVFHDAAYASLVFEGRPLSFLATPGALDVGVELHSASKSFNMTGWRCGFVAGNPKIIRAYGDVKDNTDSGQFLAIQHATAHAFDHPEISRDISEKYSRRMDLMVASLGRLGFRAKKPKGSFFLYVPAPHAVLKGRDRKDFSGAEEVSEWLIKEKLISTVPWDEAGAYLRWSVTFNAPTLKDERRVIAELESRMGDVQFEW